MDCWRKSINKLINEYEQNKIKQKKIQIPSNLRNNKEIVDLKKHLNSFYQLPAKKLFYKFNNQNLVITVIGYADEIDKFSCNILSKFNNLENNINDRLKRKLKVNFDKKLSSNMAIIFQLANGFYLKGI